jgi:TPP-dependent pyruvate/acetoin dehydrogenase alpha subunit
VEAGWFSSEEASAEEQQAIKELSEAEEFARESPFPDPDDMAEFAFAS